MKTSSATLQLLSLLVFLSFSTSNKSNMSASSSSSLPLCPKKMITLKSSEGETFQIEETVALQSKTLENMIKNCAGTPIPLRNISGKILAKVVEFCNKHAEVGVDAESLRGWDAEFVNVEYPTLFDYILAANFLEIPTLLDLASAVVADMMKGKTPAEIRKIFNIKDTFSPEEEEVCRANPWAFE